MIKLLNLSTEILGLDKTPLMSKATYAVARIIEENGTRTVEALRDKEGAVVLEKTGEPITVANKLIDYLLGENKEDTEAKAVIGWKILMSSPEQRAEFKIAEADYKLLQKTVAEKEKNGLIFVQISECLKNAKEV